ncbi:MAG TPA: CBS domain-containing protein, partial [Thiohalobacter sp.]|nr:CBS domain-containing protein [Thiohalobacter sp.]
RKGLGMTAVLDDRDRVIGIFTDGDLRRAVDHNVDLHNTDVASLMTPDCITVKPGLLAAEALAIMDSRKINGLLVVDDEQRLVGALGMHDLLRAGVV